MIVLAVCLRLTYILRTYLTYSRRTDKENKAQLEYNQITI